MGLDLGVVNIKYIDRPGGAALKFVSYLGENYWDADWGFSEGENIIVENTKETMFQLVDDYAKSEGLADDDKASILEWVRGLPWKDDVIMLHLSW